MRYAGEALPPPGSRDTFIRRAVRVTVDTAKWSVCGFYPARESAMCGFRIGGIRTMKRVRVPPRIPPYAGFALGSDAMAGAMRGYGLLKSVSGCEGLDQLRRDLGSRFSKTRRSAPLEKKAA